MYRGVQLTPEVPPTCHKPHLHRRVNLVPSAAISCQLGLWQGRALVVSPTSHVRLWIGLTLSTSSASNHSCHEFSGPPCPRPSRLPALVLFLPFLLPRALDGGRLKHMSHPQLSTRCLYSALCSVTSLRINRHSLT